MQGRVVANCLIDITDPHPNVLLYDIKLKKFKELDLYRLTQEISMGENTIHFYNNTITFDKKSDNFIISSSFFQELVKNHGDFVLNSIYFPNQDLFRDLKENRGNFIGNKLFNSLSVFKNLRYNYGLFQNNHFENIQSDVFKEMVLNEGKLLDNIFKRINGSVLVNMETIMGEVTNNTFRNINGYVVHNISYIYENIKDNNVQGSKGFITNVLVNKGNITNNRIICAEEKVISDIKNNIGEITHNFISRSKYVISNIETNKAVISHNGIEESENVLDNISKFSLNIFRNQFVNCINTVIIEYEQRYYSWLIAILIVKEILKLGMLDDIQVS